MRFVTIVTPIYNSKDYIFDTIDSVINQTYIHWEYILVDDCSTDNCINDIIKKYSNEPRIKIIKSAVNSGAGVARNLALAEAKGSVIAFLDADDIWSENKLEIQLKFMDTNNSAIVHSSYNFINVYGERIQGKVNVSKSVNLNSYMRNTEIGMSTSLVDKEKTGDFRMNVARTRQDTYLWLNLLGRGFVSHGINQELVSYRIRPGQISGNKIFMLYRTLKVFLSVKQIPFYGIFINYVFYIFNSIVKRLNR